MSAMSSVVLQAKIRQHHLSYTEKIGCLTSIDKGLIEGIDLYRTVMRSAQLFGLHGGALLSMESKCITRLQRHGKVTGALTNTIDTPIGSVYVN